MKFNVWLEYETKQLALVQFKKTFFQVVKAIIKAIKLTTTVETAMQARSYSDFLFKQNNFLSWIKQLHPSFDGKYTTTCGRNGCANFIGNNIVVKISFDGHEASIMNQMKNTKIVPVIDVVTISLGNEEVYAIATHQLQTNLDHLYKPLYNASSIVAEFIDTIKTGDAEIDPLKYITVGNIRKNYSNLDQETIFYIKQLLDISRNVYKGSGRLVGPDFRLDNMGYSSKLKRIQVFDMGNSFKAGNLEVDDKPMKTISIANENTSFKKWIKEHEKKVKYSFAAVLFPLPEEIKSQILHFAKEHISEKDVYLPEGGFETNPHITVLYGLKDKDFKKVREKIENVKPFGIQLGKITKFSNRDEYDVLKIDIKGKPLHDLNKIIGQIPHHSSFDEYKPHCTLAYVKKDRCKNLVGSDFFEGKKITVDRVYFTDTRKDKTLLKLK